MQILITTAIKTFLFTGLDKSGTPVTKLFTEPPDNKTYNQASPIVYNLSDYNFTGLRDRLQILLIMIQMEIWIFLLQDWIQMEQKQFYMK